MSRKFYTPIDLAGNELQNVRIQNLVSNPTASGEGQIIYNSTLDLMLYWNGTVWVDMSGASLFQPLDADLTAIAALAGTTGLLRKTALNTWSLDTTTYLTANQTITLSGEASGSGATAITVTLSNSAVIGKVLTGYTVGANTALAATDSILGAFQKVQGQLDAKVNSSLLGANNGVATLGADGKVPSGQLPSYVDDVLEYANAAAFPVTGETSKIYIALDTGKIYRWTGTVYVEISPTAGNADTATKWLTARSITQTGEVSWTVTIDGSANVSAAATISNQAVIDKVLTGLDNTGTAFTLVAPADSIVDAIEKLQGQTTYLNNRVIDKVSQQIGNGTDVAFTITHNLGTRAVSVNVYQTASPYAQVECDVELTSINSVTIRFSPAIPTTNQYEVVILG